MAARSWILAAWFIAAWLAAPGLAADKEDDWQRRALELNSITGEETMRGQIKILADDPEGSKKLLAAAQELVKEKKQPLNFNALYILARLAQDLKDLDAGKVFYRLCADQAKKLDSGHKLAQSYSGWIDLLYDQKKYEDSEKLCKEFLELEDDKNPRVRALKAAVLRRMIQAIAKQGKLEQALKLADNYIKLRNDNWLAYELKAWVLREGGKYEDSANAYEDVLDRINKDNNLDKTEKEEYAESCRYILSGVYVDMRKIDKAAEHLKANLAQKPDDPTYNNDLGYIWADNDMNLDEAEKMIRKALDEDRKQRKKNNPDLKPEEDKDNAAYLDSLGWVLFKQKKFKEAKEALQKAVEDKAGQHIEILDHLADVHLALGDKTEAIATWKKALDVAGTNKREQERKSKVEKKLQENR